MPKKNNPLDALNNATTQLISLYEEHLPEVDFPDVNSEILSNAAQSLQEKAQALENAKEQVMTLEKGLQEEQEALMRLSIKAKGYALVFGEENDALRKALTKLTFKSTKPLKKKRASKAAKPRIVSDEGGAKNEKNNFETKEKVDDELVEALLVEMDAA